MAEIGVVHLVRERNGPAPLERFLASYREHPAGVPHELVLIFKGFASRRGTEAHDRMLTHVPHQRIYLVDRGFDVGPYFRAVATLDHRFFCFLNSFSRVLVSDWLAKLHSAASARGVGVVGATGSYQSFATTGMEQEAVLRDMSRRARLRWRLGHIFEDPQPRAVVQRGAAWLLREMGIWIPSRHFPHFPNYHVRTNAFMASRETLARVRIGPILVKASAFMFESGRQGLTHQLLRRGLRPLVVGRDGTPHEKEHWHRANIFRQRLQEDLLIADNQTDLYLRSSSEHRAALSRHAWGKDARPA